MERRKNLTAEVLSAPGSSLTSLAYTILNSVLAQTAAFMPRCRLPIPGWPRETAWVVNLVQTHCKRSRLRNQVLDRPAISVLKT